ncbi:MAG TPA: hypothetical protein VLX28_26415 [Thermoanaerobaculia bacterium]|nr:hypothetical protein [Thermoanaerobaculia bacterium]
MQTPLDFYTLKARLSPALLAILPLLITGITFFPQYLTSWKSLYAIAVSCGLIYLLAELGRRAGTLKQEGLYKSWGGKPSVAMLRHRKTHNKALVAERHRKLTLLFPHLSLPSPEEERQNTKRADEIYEVLGESLKDRTRDKKTFPLLFQENCSYGFWRNLWGLKPVGITTSLMALASILTLALRPAYFASIDRKALIAPLILDIGFLFVWIFWVTPKSIRVPAEAYAERLLEACDELIRQAERQKPAK